MALGTRIEARWAGYAKAARASLRKDRRVNLRISTPDLEAIQLRALQEGIPYQTLMASVLHKFASGRLTDTGARTGSLFGAHPGSVRIRPGVDLTAPVIEPGELDAETGAEVRR